MTRREALAAVLISVAMIAAGLTWMFGPWGLIGTGAVVLAGVLTVVNERREAKPNA